MKIIKTNLCLLLLSFLLIGCSQEGEFSKLGKTPQVEAAAETVATNKSTAPVAENISLNIEPGKVLTFEVPQAVDPDSDEMKLNYSIVTDESNGNLECFILDKRKCTYTADESFIGTVSATYKVSDEFLQDSNIAKISITVKEMVVGQGYVEHGLKSTSSLTNDNVNVVFIIDNSGSMSPSKSLLASGLKNIATSLEGFNANFFLYSVDPKQVSTLYNYVSKDNTRYYFLPDEINNTFKSVTKDMNVSQLESFSAGLEQEVNDIPINTRLSDEQGTYVSTMLLIDPRTREEGKILDTKRPTAFVHITDEDETNSCYSFQGCNYIATPQLLAPSVTVRNNSIFIVFKNTSSDLEAGNTYKYLTIDSDISGFALSCSSEGFKSFYQRQTGYALPSNCSSVSLTQHHGSKAFTGTKPCSKETAIEAGLSNTYNFHSCVSTEERTVWSAPSFDYKNRPLDEFKKEVESKLGFDRFLYYPIVYSSTNLNTTCSGKDTSNMKDAVNIRSMADYFKLKGSMVKVGDICENDYSKGLKDMLGAFVNIVHERVYKVGASSSIASVDKVILKSGNSIGKVLLPSQYQVNQANGEFFVKLSDSLALDSFDTVRIEFSEP